MYSYICLKKIPRTENMNSQVTTSMWQTRKLHIGRYTPGRQQICTQTGIGRQATDLPTDRHRQTDNRFAHRQASVDRQPICTQTDIRQTGKPFARRQSFGTQTSRLCTQAGIRQVDKPFVHTGRHSIDRQAFCTQSQAFDRQTSCLYTGRHADTLFKERISSR